MQKNSSRKQFSHRDIEDVELPFNGCQRRTIPLIDKEPEIAAEWCYKRNCGWGPEDFGYGSSVKAWWVCSFCNREYKANICDRTGHNRSACPYCASKKVCEDNALSVFYPELGTEWHPKKNGRLKFTEVTRASTKKVWWLCSKCGHEWEAQVCARAQNETGCPACYETHLEYIRENPKRAERKRSVIRQDKRISRIWYERPGTTYVSVLKSHPEIAKEWHPTHNGEWRPKDFATGSQTIVWWKCKKSPDHEWQTPIYKRTGRGDGCPFCRGLKASVTNSLRSLFPQIAEEWHPKKNGKLKPENVTRGSSKKVWWQCKYGHSWQQMVKKRTATSAPCSQCKRKR